MTLAFPGLKLPAQELVIKPDALPGDKDASIGMLVLSRFVVELDHESPAVRLHEPETFRYSGPGRAFPFSIEDNNPFTSATLTLRDGRQVAARMVIDTGAVGSIAYFSRSFAIQNKLAERALASRARYAWAGRPAVSSASLSARSVSIVRWCTILGLRDSAARTSPMA